MQHCDLTGYQQSICVKFDNAEGTVDEIDIGLAELNFHILVHSLFFFNTIFYPTYIFHKLCQAQKAGSFITSYPVTNNEGFEVEICN